MRILCVVMLVLSLVTAAQAQQSVNPQNGFPNDTTTGTVLHGLAKLNDSGTVVVMSTADAAANAIGVVTAGAGTHGSATVQQGGIVKCNFDSATVALDYVVNSGTVAGDCHDAGTTLPANGNLGRVLSSNASSGSYSMWFSRVTIGPAFTTLAFTPLATTINSNSYAMIDWSSQILTVTVNNTNITLPVCSQNGTYYMLQVLQDSIGGHPYNILPPLGWQLTWQLGGSEPAPSLAANLSDFYSFRCYQPTSNLSETGFVPAVATSNISLFNFATIFSAAGTPIPPCSTQFNHYRGCVSDSTGCTNGTPYTSGGSTGCELFCNGTSWMESGSGC